MNILENNKKNFQGMNARDTKYRLGYYFLEYYW